MKQVYIIKNNLVMVDLINDHKSRIEMEINSSHCKLLVYDDQLRALNTFTHLRQGEITHYCRDTNQFVIWNKFKVLTICMN